MEQPLPNTYWVVPGRFLAGEHPCGVDDAESRIRIERLCAAGLDYFIDLTHEYELPGYGPLLPPTAQYLRSAIHDTEVPESVLQMRDIQAQIRSTLASGGGIYVHCRAGIGRTGTVVGCYLAEHGLGGKAALKQLNRLWQQSARSRSWPKVPQTAEQADYIRRWPQSLAAAAQNRGSR